MLLNFRSDNFTGISTIIPASLKVQNEKPSSLLNKILEDYQTCNEIPFDKRPDSLFANNFGDFTIKIPFSKLISCHFAEAIENYSGKNELGLIAVDIVYDTPPTAEKVLNLLGNLTGYKGYEVAGIVAAHGYFFSAFLKSADQWKSFAEGKMSSWLNLVWSFCTSSAYPVMIVLSSSNGKSTPCYLSKIDIDAMQKFCKLQDSRIKLSFIESFIEPTRSKASQYPNLHLKPEDQYKDYTSEYMRRTQDYLRAPFAEEKLLNSQESEEKKPFKQETPSKETLVSKRSEGDKKEDTYEYIRAVQDYKVRTDPTPPSKNRNFSSEPYSQTSSRAFKDDLLYRSSKNDSIETDRPSKPGILKNSSIEARYGRMQSYTSASPLTSPKDQNSSNTYRESSGFEEEYTEKPYPILKNSWMSDRKDHNEKKVNFSDPVFEIDNSVKGQMPEIKFSNARPLGKSAKTPDYKVDYRRDYSDIKPATSYTTAELKSAASLKQFNSRDVRESRDLRQTPDYREGKEVKDVRDSRSYRELRESKETKSTLETRDGGSWACPKCSSSIPLNSYECSSCRYINWDKFYSLKSKGGKVRSESIPAKTTELEPEPNRAFRQSYYDTPGRDTWRQTETKGYDRFTSDNVGRLTSRDFFYNR